MHNNSNQQVYLDHAGAALPSKDLLEAVANSLLTARSERQWLANPHSGHAMGQRSRALVHRARNRVLFHFDADPSEFCVIFTSNATAGLKLLAESFTTTTPQEQQEVEFTTDLRCLKDPTKSTLLMLQDSHTSVVGMRQLGTFQRVVVAPFEHLHAFLKYAQMEQRIVEKKTPENAEEKAAAPSLFVMTAMSNFCGRIYDFRVAELLKEVLGSHWKVCFDSAALAGHSDNIGLNYCDFAVLSFYKIFGYPTGLGALLVRRTCAHLLQKRYFGGGTVNFASPHSMDVNFRGDLAERMEDGTPNIYAIQALLLALNDDELDYGTTQENAMDLAERAFDLLSNLKHPNGSPLVRIYGEGWEEFHSPIYWHKREFTEEMVQGPIINFNLLRDDGSYIGFVEVDRMADLFGIQLRTGCHCNLGACAMHLGLDERQMQQHFQMGKVCGDGVDLLNGRPLGTVRISFGRTSTDQDLQIFRQMLECCFLSHGQIPRNPENGGQANTIVQPVHGFLTHMFIYPIKSCAALRKESWSIYAKSGALLYDRHWAIVRTATGEWLTQKRYPALCSIMPELKFFETSKAELILRDRHGFPHYIQFTPLDDNCSTTENAPMNGMSCINGSNLGNLLDFGGPVTSDWLANLDESLMGCKLVVANARECELDEDEEEQSSRQTFANQADFLLITLSSVKHIADHLGMDVESLIERFRPNFVVDFGPSWEPFQEEQIKRLSIGSCEFKVVGVCQRCQMICIDQVTGQKDPNVLVALRNMRMGQKSKLAFGVYLELVKPPESADSAHSSTFTGRRELHTGCNVRLLPE